jgi:hypothetical protein
MLAGLRQHVTYANVMATVAVFVALGGTSIAAVSLKRNSVKGKHIAPNAVTSPKVKNESLLAQDFAPGQLPTGAKGDRGDQGPPGGNGAPGTNGTPGTNGQDSTAPQGAVMFFELTSCPTGWTELASARGRYILGRPSGGLLSAQVGTPLNDQENRAVGQHNHGSTSTDGVHTHTVVSGPLSGAGGAALDSGLSTMPSGTSTSASGNHAHSTSNAGTVVGTNAPYLQLLACKKD